MAFKLKEWLPAAGKTAACRRVIARKFRNEIRPRNRNTIMSRALSCRAEAMLPQNVFHKSNTTTGGLNVEDAPYGDGSERPDAFGCVGTNDDHANDARNSSRSSTGSGDAGSLRISPVRIRAGSAARD